jgi:hypothetical protein
VTTTESEQLTGKGDAVFDLRNVFSEAAESSQVCVNYIDDAAEVGDSELVEFFKDVQEQEAWRAQKAKTLINRR